jgi:serine/threonine-protein kinase
MVRGLDRLPALPGEILAERYRIERVLGAGGMGIVLCARDLRGKQRVAIKMMNPSSTRAADVARFRLEAEIHALLDCPRVGKVFQVGEVSGVPYVAMEYFEGRTLADALASDGPFSVERAIACLRETCEALADVHELGIVHRDVKLENLLLLGTSRVQIKLIDFGIAKMPGANSIESPTCSVGSPRYMAPEQLERASDVDHRADIWSVGIVAFELLTGAHPFVGDTVQELRRAILEEDAPSLLELRPDVPRALIEIIERCLTKDRSERFQSVHEIIEMLERVKHPVALAS